MTTGIAWVDGLLLVIGVVSVIFGAVAAVTRSLRPLVHGVGQFLDDWNGEPERPGVSPARPGVMARIAAIEHELHPNGGSSLRDAVNRIESAQQEQKQQPQAGTVVHVHSPADSSVGP